MDIGNEPKNFRHITAENKEITDIWRLNPQWNKSCSRMVKQTSTIYQSIQLLKTNNRGNYKEKW